MGAYTRRAVETDVLAHVDAVLSNPYAPLSIGVLTGSSRHGVDAVLAHGVVPRLAAREGAQAVLPVQVRGDWDALDASEDTVGYCVTEADVPASAPPPDAPLRVLLVTCTDVNALPTWITEDPAAAVRTLPIGTLSPFEAHDAIEAQLGGRVDARSAYRLAELSGFLPVSMSVIVAEARARGALGMRDGSWSLLSDPVQTAIVPYVRAQLATADPGYAQIMLHLALREPFSWQSLPAEEAEVAVQLLKEGELRRQDDGRIAFSAPAASSALRSAATADDERHIFTEMLQGSAPSFHARLWALRAGQPIDAHDLFPAMIHALGSADRQTAAAAVALLEDGETADVLRADARSILHAHAVFTLRRLADPPRARTHLARAACFRTDSSDAAPAVLTVDQVAEIVAHTASGRPSAALREATAVVLRISSATDVDPIQAEELRAATAAASLAVDGPGASPPVEHRLGDSDPAIDLAGLLFRRASWDYARGGIAAAQRWGVLARDAGDDTDPWGTRAAATALLAETCALLGDHAQASAHLAACSANPMDASAAIAGIVQGHTTAARLLLDAPGSGEALRQVAADYAGAGHYGLATDTLYAGVRFGRRRAARDLIALADVLKGRVHERRIAHAAALLADDPLALAEVAEQLHGAGMRLLAAEVHAAALKTENPPATLRNRLLGRLATYVSEEPLDGHAVLRVPHAPAGELRLTPRERDVAGLIDSGLSNAEIADHLRLSITTVEGHITRIYRKTGATRRAPARR